MVERSVGETCGDEGMFDRPSMFLCIPYGRREGYASSRALQSLPLLHERAMRVSGGVWDVGLTGLSCRLNFGSKSTAASSQLSRR